MLSIALLLLSMSQTAVEPMPVTQILAESRDGFERLLQKNPSDVAAQDGEVKVSEKMALEARSAGHNDEALTDLLRAQKFAPENPQVLFDLGILEDEMQLYLDADKTLAHLAGLTPNDPKVLYAVAHVKLDLGQLAVAEENMRAYLKAQPNDASAHYGLGRIYRQGLELDKAKAELELSIALQPRQTEAYYQLGDIQLEQENYVGAVQDFNRTLSRNPMHGGALAGTGIAYYRQKQYDRAVQYLDQAIQAAPDYQPGHYYLGLTLARLGKADESKRELSIATKLAEKDNLSSANRLRLSQPGPEL